MRRIIIVVLSAALLATTAWAIRGAAAEPSRPAQAAAGAVPAAAHQHGANMTATSVASPLAEQLAAGRLATLRFANNLHAAKTAGYQILTRMIPDMGYHFINPSIQGFDIRKPPILVYERKGDTWQLGAVEWVFPSTPATPPLPGATYGTFGAACHYKDGTFVFASSQDQYAKRSPQTGARFNLWHPDLITMHVWLWYPNPDGLLNGTNANVTPFNGN
jgi:hypothetical protein